MFLFALVPLALIVLPIVALVISAGHTSRIKALELEVTALKEQASAPRVASPAPSQPSAGRSAVPAASQAAKVADEPIDMPMAPRTAGPADAEDASGRILGRIGIGAVLIGVAFFLKYAFDNDWIGPAGRVMVGIVIGLGIIGIGQYLRAKYLRYSDLLIGGGIAVLYLALFAAKALYGIMDPSTAAVLMFVVTLFAFAISIYNATQTLAVVAIVGAFATPFLVSSGDDSMLTLFGYMILINGGVLCISFFKKWLRLNIASFVGTAILFLSWFGSYYSSDALPPTLVFCVISFVIFLISQVARSISAGIKADAGDYVLMSGNAFALASMLYALLAPEYHATLGFASVLVALVYMGFAFVVNRANPSDVALNIFLPTLAVIFLSIAVPMQLTGPWIAVAWFMESCALYGIASVIGNRGFQVMGLLVYLLGLLDFFAWYVSRPSDPAFAPFFNAPFALFLLAIAAAYGIAYIYHRYGSVALEVQKRGIVAFLVIANVLSIWALSLQVTSFYDAQAAQISQAQSSALSQAAMYSNGYDADQRVTDARTASEAALSSNTNMSNTLVSILWALYAAALTAIGFVRRLVSMRRFGLVLFLVTALKVLVDVWSIGQLYRIISFIVFGVIALVASFAYVKYKDRLKGVLSLAAVIGLSSIAFAGLAFGGAETARADFSPSDWQFMRPIDAPSTSGFVKASLPTDISWTARDGQGFSDIRVIDGQGNEVAYLLERGQTTAGPVTQARLIGLGTRSDQSVAAIADLGKSGVVHSRLDLAIDPRAPRFQRQVSVYASDSLLSIDDPHWSLVASNGFIYRITDASSGSVLGKYSVEFPANASRYLKFVIASGAEGAVDAIGASASGDSTSVSSSVVASLPASVSSDAVRKVTDVVVDLGAPGRLSDAATLSVGSSDVDYIRRVVVHASDSLATSSWRYAGEGSISRVSTNIFKGESGAVTYPEQRARYLKLSIVNDDNPPLSVSSSVAVSMPVLSLVFQARPGSSYTLYYGNPSARQPEYDMSGLSSYIDRNSLPIATIGAESANASYIAPKPYAAPYTESHAWVLDSVLALLVLIIGAGAALYLKAYLKAHPKKGGF